MATLPPAPAYGTKEWYELRIERFTAAIDAVLLGQSYEIDGRRMTRANLSDLQKGLEWLHGGLTGIVNTPINARRVRTIRMRD